ncbi:MAG: ABC transporter ATP-binding protein [Myxococcales bacterium]|nr:ABC transporter ATP-binding protein/permease [Myxococcota bacterium]MDW8281766.1 ABC transporter ATP-binding protein [Myxococcales bacterium]
MPADHASPRPPVQTLGLYLRRHAACFVAGAVALLLTGALAFAIPRVIGGFIDALGSLAGVPPRDPPGRLRLPGVVQEAIRRAAQEQPVWIAAVLGGLATLAGLFRVLSRLAIFHAGRRVEHELRRELFDHLSRLPPSYFRRTPTGDLLSRAINDLTAVRMVFGPGVLNLVNTAVVCTWGVTLLLRLDAALALWALVPYPLVLVVARHMTRRVYEHSARVQAELGALSEQAQQTLSNIQLVQLYGRQEQHADAYAAAGQAYLRANMALALCRGLLGPLVALGGGLGLVVTLWLGGRRVLAGTLTLGQWVEFQGYLGMLTWPTMALGWVLSLWQRGQAALARINAVLQERPTLADPPPDRVLPAPAVPSGGIQVRGLSVHRGGEPVLHDIHLVVPPGAHLGVVGRAGAGKSTLAEALARMLEVPEGTVFLDGLDVTRLPLRTARGAIAYVPQESFLLSASIRDNLTFGVQGPPPDEARLRRIIEMVRLDADLAALPQGLDTQVGERGVQLSGGQRQRVALGRALLRQAPVLILDDALSAVDAQTEADILAALRRELGGRTVIIVSHRVAAVRAAQQIIVLERGRIVEQGRHEELVAQGGLYAHLHRLQHLAAEVEATESGEPVLQARGTA